MKKILGWIFTLWLPTVGIAWLIISLISKKLGIADGGYLHDIKWVLGRTFLLAPFLFPIGITLLCKGSKVGEYISYGWKLAKKNIKQYWFPLLSIFIIVGILAVLSQTYGTVYLPNGKEELNTLGVVLVILNRIVGVFYGIGLVKLGLQAGDEEKKFGIKTMFVHTWSEIWKTIVSVLLFGIVMFIPITLTIILLVGGILGSGINLILDQFPTETINSLPTLGVIRGTVMLLLGLVLMVYLAYVSLRINPVLKYAVINHATDLEPWGMIKRSWKISKGKVWRLFAVGFVAGLTNILGVLTLGIGLLWTVPLTFIAMAKIYKDLDTEYEKNSLQKE